MFKLNCVVKYLDNFGVEHTAKVEAESLFEAAVRGLLLVDLDRDIHSVKHVLFSPETRIQSVQPTDRSFEQ